MEALEPAGSDVFNFLGSDGLALIYHCWTCARRLSDALIKLLWLECQQVPEKWLWPACAHVSH